MYNYDPSKSNAESKNAPQNEYNRIESKSKDPYQKIINYPENNS